MDLIEALDLVGQRLVEVVEEFDFIIKACASCCSLTGRGDLKRLATNP